MSTRTLPAHVPPGMVQDYDPFGEAESAENPFRRLRKFHDGPDIFFNPASFRGDGAWIITRTELIREVLQDPSKYSSHGCAGFSKLVGEDWDMIPLELDPPKHASFRALMNPLFAPKEVDKLETRINALAIELIEGLRPKGSCEFVQDFGTPFPVTIILELMGLPQSELETFLQWEHDLLHEPDLGIRQKAAFSILHFLRDLIAQRKKNPTEDLVGFAANAVVDGKPISDDESLGICYLLFVGGLDTVAASLGYMFRYLATHHEVQDQLIKQRNLIPEFVEEMLRCHSPVATRRTLTQDVDFHGVAMKKGDVIECITGLASQDPQEFDHPEEVHIERSPNRHLAFAAGPHRCIGSHLARREMRIAVDEWLTRIPHFRIEAGAEIKSHAGVFGLDKLPLVWEEA